MCVAERHADRGVPENLLERQEVTSLDHVVGSESVAEVVKADLPYT